MRRKILKKNKKEPGDLSGLVRFISDRFDGIDSRFDNLEEMFRDLQDAVGSYAKRALIKN
jgi:hypothetical protein